MAPVTLFVGIGPARDVSEGLLRMKIEDIAPFEAMRFMGAHAFVDFATQEDADKIIRELDQVFVNSSRLVVKVSDERRPDRGPGGPPPPRRDDYYGGHGGRGGAYGGYPPPPSADPYGYPPSSRGGYGGGYGSRGGGAYPPPPGAYAPPGPRYDERDRYDAPRGGPPSSAGGCFNCGRPGHKAADCPEPRREGPGAPRDKNCYNCGKPGHPFFECPEPRRDKQDAPCFNCGRSGHRAADCPEPKSMDQMKCFSCGGRGHRAADCPNPAPRGGGGRGGGYPPRDDFRSGGRGGRGFGGAYGGRGGGYDSYHSRGGAGRGGGGGGGRYERDQRFDMNVPRRRSHSRDSARGTDFGVFEARARSRS